MNREDVRKLMGGYATGTLTPEEQQALFAAALEDQELWDDLAREQSLRDLLRDPAAKAQVLAALDAVRVPWYRHVWWRPAAVAAAMAGIAAMAVVLTWKSSPAPQPVTVAELRGPEAELRGPGAELRKPGAEIRAPGAGGRELAGGAGAPVGRRAKPLMLLKQEHAAAPPRDLPVPPAPLAAPSPLREEPAILAASGKQLAGPSPPPPRFGAASADSVEVRAQKMPMAMAAQQGQQLGQLGLRNSAAGGGGALDSRFLAANARLLFYGKPVAADEVASRMGASVTLAAVPASHLGVRCSILQKQAGGETAEVGIETVLGIGEQVKLKIVPNDRGYLRVWEPGPNGTLRSIASGVAQPLQPFEATLPEFASPGARQLYVQFTRGGQAVPADPPPQSSQWTLAGANLIQTVANGPEKATYVVNRFSGAAAQQVLVPVTLNYK
jgi:hypothetical protein